MYIADQTTYHFNADAAPLFKAQPGETILFKTQDCFSGQVTEGGPGSLVLDFNHCNPATGPIYIDGAEPGDVLVVDVLDIRSAGTGIVSVMENGGPLWDETAEARTRILPIRDGVTEFLGVRWNVTPMIGVIGVAPHSGKAPTGHPFHCGGNLDCNRIVKGSRVYLPVQVPGALLGMGDLHASMGDGEVCGTGIEIAGEVLVQTKLVKGFALNWPVVETQDMWYVCACDMAVDEAIRLSLRELRRLVMGAYGWDSTDTFMYLSIRGNVEVNQSCLTSTVENVVRAGVPKDAALPRLIR